MKKLKLLVPGLLICISSVAHANGEGMPGMPKLEPKRSLTVQSNEQGQELQESRGFGDEEGMVRMMNLMMVGGSGYEGMDMSEMSAAHQHAKHVKAGETTPAEDEISAQISPNPPRVGANILELVVRRPKEQAPASGLKVRVQVSMTSMDMGTEEPRVKESTPGRYEAKVVFSMKGPWAVKVILPSGGEKVFEFNVGAAGN